MSENRDLYAEAASRLFADMVEPGLIKAAEEGSFPTQLWAELDELGLLSMLVGEDQGGVGADLEDAAAVSRTVGYHAAPGPIAETIVARWLVGEAGLSVPPGPLAVIVGANDNRGAWLRAASAVRASGNRIDIFSPSVDCLTEADLTGEPFDRLPDGAVATLGADLEDAEGRARRAMAILRVAQMAGAMEWCVERSVAYVQEREQFGKPLAKLQIIQQYLAQAAGEFVAADLLAGTAAQAGSARDAEWIVAAARVRAADAADVVAALSHQVHGAIGFSREYALNFRTRRLMAWRDSGTSSVDSARLVGSSICADGRPPWEIICARTAAAA